MVKNPKKKKKSWDKDDIKSSLFIVIIEIYVHIKTRH